MTVIEFELYRSIKSFECLNQRWAKKNKETDAPNIIAMIDRFNLVRGHGVTGTPPSSDPARCAR